MARDTKALTDHVTELKQDCVRLTVEILHRCQQLQQAAYDEADEAIAWAAGIEASRARHAFDQAEANLDRIADRLRAEGTS